MNRRALLSRVSKIINSCAMKVDIVVNFYKRNTQSKSINHHERLEVEDFKQLKLLIKEYPLTCDFSLDYFHKKPFKECYELSVEVILYE